MAGSAWEQERPASLTGHRAYIEFLGMEVEFFRLELSRWNWWFHVHRLGFLLCRIGVGFSNKNILWVELAVIGSWGSGLTTHIAQGACTYALQLSTMTPSFIKVFSLYRKVLNHISLNWIHWGIIVSILLFFKMPLKYLELYKL